MLQSPNMKNDAVEISQFDEPTEIDTKQETVDNDLFKHEIHDESISMQE